jgi:hypothetical protein
MPMKNKSNLRLVYSATWVNTGDTNSGEKTQQSSNWSQLELFPSEKKDLVIFAHPERSTVHEILGYVIEKRIKHILDLRVLPVLSFDQISRDDFFSILESNHVDYIALQSFVRKINRDSAQEFFDAICSNSVSEVLKLVRETFKELIEDGPTIVFTDSYPTQDPVVDDFRRSLVCSGIHFSPIFAVGERMSSV